MASAQAAKWLGLDPDDWIARVEGGLDPQVIDRLIQEGKISRDEAFELIVPRRTFARRRARSESLSREESDRLARFARIMSFAERVFGDASKARAWMRTANGALDSRTPLSLLKTDAGAQAVENVLWRIADGVYS